MKTGVVSIVGRPNVGKSSLINSIINKKIAITTSKPQTTRTIIKGIYNDEESQIIFIDTPGIHKPKEKIGNILNKKAYFSMSDVDLTLLLIDVTEPLGTGDKFVINKLNEFNNDVILVLNKIDKIKKEKIITKIEEYKDLYDFKEIVPVSALTNDNTNVLIKVIKSYLSEGVKEYEDDYITDMKNDFLISEIIREKIIDLTHDEVPYSVMCEVEEIIKDKSKTIIRANIITNKKSIKGMIIGKSGTMIKEIGTKARVDIQDLLKQKVFLELFVKVIKDWDKKAEYLK